MIMRMMISRYLIFFFSIAFFHKVKTLQLNVLILIPQRRDSLGMMTIENEFWKKSLSYRHT